MWNDASGLSLLAVPAVLIVILFAYVLVLQREVARLRVARRGLDERVVWMHERMSLLEYRTLGYAAEWYDWSERSTPPAPPVPHRVG